MLRRQLFVFLVIGLFVLALGACAKKQTAAPEPAPPPVEETVEPAEPEVEEVEVEEEPMMKMPVVEDIFFEFDKSRITDEAKQKLANNAQQLKDAPNAMIMIEGHADERGTNAYNLALGERRANATKDYLVTLGVDGSRISTMSYGEERPFDTGHNEAAWAKNRRAHFVVQQ
jgi:peptidoglycan-associated lipoprotein